MICPHPQHPDLESAIACSCLHTIVEQTREERSVAVLVERGDRSHVLSLFANTAGMALMAKTLCEQALRDARPTCPTCASAWDRCSQALVILSKFELGECS